MTVQLPSAGRIILLEGTNPERHQLLNTIQEIYAPVYVNLMVSYDFHEINFDDSAYILLDECDSVPEKHLRKILSYLLSKTSAQIIVNGRDVSACIYRDKFLRQYIILYPSCRWATDQTLVQVKGFGQGYISVDMLTKPDLAGQLPGILMFYMLEKETISATEADTEYWLEKPEKTAGNTFQVTKKTLHDTFRRKLIMYSTRTFSLSDQLDIVYDVWEFETLIQAYYREKKLDYLQRAIVLYQDDFLTGIELMWVQKRRDVLRKMYHRALFILANSYFEQSDKTAAAIGLLTRILRDVPDWEDASYLLMQSYIKLNLIGDACQVHARLCTALMSYNIKPSAKIQALAQQWCHQS